MLRVTVTIEPRYFVNVGSTWLRPIAARISAVTRLISQRPTNQNASAARILMPRSIAVVLRNTLMACVSMSPTSRL